MLFYSGFMFCFLYSWYSIVDNNPYTIYNIDLGIINKPIICISPTGKGFVVCLFLWIYIPYGKKKRITGVEIMPFKDIA